MWLTEVLERSYDFFCKHWRTMTPWTSQPISSTVMKQIYLFVTKQEEPYLTRQKRTSLNSQHHLLTRARYCLGVFKCVGYAMPPMTVYMWLEKAEPWLDSRGSTMQGHCVGYQNMDWQRVRSWLIQVSLSLATTLSLAQPFASLQSSKCRGWGVVLFYLQECSDFLSHSPILRS